MDTNPKLIGPFQIQSELGRGGMGEVFLARDTRLDRQVAIKALPAHLSQDPDRLARFQREAKVLASLNHPGIGAIYGLEEAEGRQYLVLEFVEGQTLAERLAQGALPVHEVLAIARQIAEALETAHEKGIVHRDLKPGNIMVTAEGVVKVLDFGLARTADGPATASPGALDLPTVTSAVPLNSPTIPGVIMGTAGYMSPEQARAKPLDKRSDIFSFGCVLFEMFTGSMPFRGETVADAIGATLHKEPDFALLPPATPPRVRELLSLCLAKDRRQRLHDIADARLELERAIAGREWAPAGAASHPSRKKVPVPLVVAAAVVLVALGAGTWSVLGPRDRVAVERACVAVPMPADLTIQSVAISRDGRTLLALGRPRDAGGPGAAQPRYYTRRLDSYGFEPLVGTEGAFIGKPTRDNRGLLFLAPISAGSVQLRLALIPLDGSAPATTITDWKDHWREFIELESGDVLIKDGDASFVRLPKAGGPPSASVTMDAGRPGVQRFEFPGTPLPGDRGALVNVVSYGSRGFQYSVGVLDLDTGRVKVIVEDGGNAAYALSGYLVFSRGDVILAAPFDLGRAELRAAPTAVWSGLDSNNPAFPATFSLTDQGALCYRPGQGDGGRSLGILGPGGEVRPWSTERRDFNSPPIVSPDGRRFVCQILNEQGIDQLWVSSVDHDDFVRLGTDQNADSFWGVWSPDGRRIAYTRVAKDGRDGIYIQDIDGGSARRVFKSESADQNAFPTSWHPDGAALFLTWVTRGKGSIMLLPLGGAEADSSSLRPYLPSDAFRGLATLSPDGRLVAFIGEETGKGQTWVAELSPGGEAGRPVQVKTARVAWHAWASDGRTLFIQDEQGRLLKTSVNPGSPPSVSAPVEVANLEKLGIRDWAPLRDGNFLVTLKAENEGETGRCDMVLNWTGILEAKVSAGR